MNQSNHDLIHKFYTSFMNKNTNGMIECYSDSIEFEDPVFGSLKGNSAKAMWQMLIEKSNDLKITFDGIEADDTFGKANWKAIYPFKTGNIITNNINAKFEIIDGKIVKHIDSFDLWKWSRMAFGWKGLIFGFTSKMQNQIKKEAKTGLELYMKRKRIQP
jgi:ketosteroid isomerase-like protein